MWDCRLTSNEFQITIRRNEIFAGYKSFHLNLMFMLNFNFSHMWYPFFKYHEVWCLFFLNIVYDNSDIFSFIVMYIFTIINCVVWFLKNFCYGNGFPLPLLPAMKKIFPELYIWCKIFKCTTNSIYSEQQFLVKLSNSNKLFTVLLDFFSLFYSILPVSNSYICRLHEIVDLGRFYYICVLICISWHVKLQNR